MRRVGLAVIALCVIAIYIRVGPIDEKLLDQKRFTSPTVVDRHGEVLYEPLSPTGTRGSSLAPAAIPDVVLQATLAAEDRRFFRHPGVDPLAMARAAWRNVRQMRVIEGGSTISQQVAKLLLASPDRGVTNKVRETILALRLEHRFNKREILAMYLNLAPYGNRIHGIGRASRAYFGCPPEHLTAAQAAYLAALPQRPGAFNPLRDPQKAMTRQKYVLASMKASASAKSERLDFRHEEQPLIAQHFVERALQNAGPQNAGPQNVGPASAGPKTIRTTLDANLQREVIGIIARHRTRLLKHGATSAAVAVLDNHTGEWLAWEGSGDYFGDPFGGAIDAVVSPRQPGSTLKPFTYAIAFENGFSPATIVDDSPAHFPTAQDGVAYSPRNYDGRYRGPMRVRSALAGSQNVPAVAMLAQLGPESLLRVLRNSGFDTLTKTADYYGLGLTLGDAEVRLDQLVAAYAMFARGGVAVKPTMFLGAQHDDGPRLFSERTAFWISDILSDADAREYVFGSGGSLDFPFRVAVKTGTSQAYRDNWTVGYTRDVTVGVWVGNFDREELRNSSGVTGAAPIFNAVMLAAVKRARGRLPIGDDDPIVPVPADLDGVSICSETGLRPSESCPSVITEWVSRNGSAQSCRLHIPAPQQAAAVQSGSKLPHSETGLITNPPDGATYLIDPTLRPGFQKLRFRATSRVRWQVNGKSADEDWPLARGKHTITAINGRKKESVQIYVK